MISKSVTLTDPAETSPKNKPLLTGEALVAADDLGSGELIEGVFIEMAPPGYWHGVIEFNIGGILREFVNKHNLGYVLGGEAGVYTARNPDTVRGMDVAFISHERMAQVQSTSYLDVAPELIVEILSPGDRWHDVQDKLAEYFAINVQVVWVADPKRKQLHVYQTVTEVEILTAADTLSGGEVLAGFEVAVANLFGQGGPRRNK